MLAVTKFKLCNDAIDVIKALQGIFDVFNMSDFSNNWRHSALYTGCMRIACPLPAFGGSIRPWCFDSYGYS